MFISASASGNTVTVTGQYGTFTTVGGTENDGIATVSKVAGAIAGAIGELDAATVGGNGQIIAKISESAGVISATAIDLTASAVAATASTATDDKVAVSGTTVAAQIESLATSIKVLM